jgi:hypothetical protein
MPTIRRRAPVLVLLLAFSLFFNGSHAADGVLGAEAAKTIPLIDGHFHIMPWMDLRELLMYMDRHGVRSAGGAAALGGPARRAEAAAALGSRYIRSTGQGEWLSLKRDEGEAALENAEGPEFQKRLAAIERDLRDSGARVVGEIHVNTLQSAGNANVRHKIKADAPTLKALLNLAARFNRPLNLHAQWDADTASEIRRLAESDRNGRLILAHCGTFATASDIRDLFQSHPNISCDLSFRSPPQLRGRALDRTIFDGRLRDEWKQLIEEFSDRFIVGVDDVHSWDDYEATLRNIRIGLLANLSPAVAEKVAYKNAQTWFALD